MGSVFGLDSIAAAAGGSLLQKNRKSEHAYSNRFSKFPVFKFELEAFFSNWLINSNLLILSLNHENSNIKCFWMDR